MISRCLCRCAHIIAILFYISFEFCLTAPPTIGDISKKQCPPDKPFKCLPYGKCYNADSYCQPASGTVETCFPTLSSGTSLLEWCRELGQYNSTLMKNKFACSLACQARFNSSELSEDLQKLSLKECPDNQPHKCPGDSQCYGSFEVCDERKVKSCFPDGIESSHLLEWCRDKGQFDVSLMYNNRCTLACQAKFRHQDLMQISEPPTTGMILFGITLAICIVQFILLWLVRHTLCKVMQGNFRNSRCSKWKWVKNLPCLKYQDKKAIPTVEGPEEFQEDPPIKKDQVKSLVPSHESQPGPSGQGLLRRQTSTNHSPGTESPNGVLLRE